MGGDLLDVCIDRDKSRFVQVKFVTNSSQLLQHPPFAVSNVGVGGQDCLRNVGILFWVVYKIYDYFDSMMFVAVSYTFYFRQVVKFRVVYSDVLLVMDLSDL